jgi:predicted DNA-binding transcriptional regulator YafY
MRAERLVAIALLLQAHRKLTAPELARRLDVSERTIRRDLDALLLSGLPLYSERGRGGGWALLDGPAINLSALTTQEAQALFLVTGPELLAGLGLEQGVTSAVRKLLAALPANTREQADRTRQAIHIDPTRWGRPAQPTPATLVPLRDAVMAGVQVNLAYAPPGADATVHRVHPYGLVSKSSIWYLVLSVIDFADDGVAGNDDGKSLRGGHGDWLVGTVPAVGQVRSSCARHGDGCLRA